MKKREDSKANNLFTKVLLVGILLLDIGIILAIVWGVHFMAHNRSFAYEAVCRGDSIILNGVRYEHGEPAGRYTVSDVLICVADDDRKLYEIAEYPGYEYIAVYSAWDGEIYKKTE